MGKYAGGGTSSGHAQEDFGRENEERNIWEIQGIKESARGEERTGMWSEIQARYQLLAGK